ncbi:protein kinase domain-containing protein [Rhodobacter capsulatus]|uniref:protein kinase domain-containing protein n=1 Tax=Rhodobacter capsulatus TaxID=1061 RepID=UPI004024E84C
MSDEDDLFLNLKEGYRLRTGSNVYRVDAVLGSGGFGITYKAWDEKLERVVAIKEYYPRDFAGRTAVQTVVPSSKTQADLFAWGKARFLDEAKTLAKFDHPGIVGVLDFFEANNTAYLVMQFIDGVPLSDQLKRHPYTEAQARVLLAQLVSALQVVHAAGFLHRDVKPSNIMLQRSGAQPVLIDFGAARHSLGHQTHSITSMASASFSPKEQYLENAPQTVASEIYSICATVYRAMFQAGPPVAISRDEDDSLRELEVAEASGTVSAAFADALRKGLAYQQRNRFQSLDELLAAIETPARAAEPPEGAEKPASPPLPTATETVSRSKPVSPQKEKRGGRALRLAAIAGLVGVTAAALALGLPRSGLLPPFAEGTGAKTGLPLSVATQTAPPPNPCALGEAAACYQAGKLMLALPGQELRASEMLQQACEMKNSDACLSVGKLFIGGSRIVKRQPALALADYISACELGSTKGCELSANLLSNANEANGFKPARKTARELIKRACALSGDTDCATLRAPRFNPSASALYVENLVNKLEGTHLVSAKTMDNVRRCHVGAGSACNTAGVAFDESHGNVDKNRMIASILFERACEQGSPFGCGNLGIDYYYGEGGRSIDLSQAASLYKIACLGGVMKSCYRLGRMNVLSQSYSSKDPALGMKMLEKACDADIAAACNVLGLGFKDGVQPNSRACDQDNKGACNSDGFYFLPENKDQEKAAEAFRKACNLADADGCRNLASFYRDGAGGLPKSSTIQNAYLKKACSLGDKTSCATVK